MKVSLNIVKRYTPVDLPVDELVSLINQQLGGVEEVIDIAKKYNGATIVRVVECAPLKGTDHLNLTKVDDGGVYKGVERDENGMVQVVCGAPNVRVDMLAVWLPPGAIVPSTCDDDEPFVLGARELRGAMSNGMLASPKELGFGDAHEGIMEIDASEWKPNNVQIKPGTSFAEAYGLDDTVIDIENKMFTHRPDCFGQLGVAREIAGILNNQFVSPDWYTDTPNPSGGEGLEMKVKNDIPDKVSRFMTVAVRDVKVGPSPIWLQAELVRLGSKPINNIVDVTNYVMLITAQPMHAYDYDKVATGELGVRMAKKDEQVALLNGKVEKLYDSDIVITDGNKVIGLGGVMGGSETEVSVDTKNIILECANFDMYTIRRTSMRHGLFTDAVTRFTKGQSPLQIPAVMYLALKSVFDVADGQQASIVVDDQNLQTFSELVVHAPQSITSDFINTRLGLNLSQKEIESILGNVEFTFDVNHIAPFWRTDIEIPEDIVEEVGRLYGFDKLPQDLPQRNLTPADIYTSRTLKVKLRDALSRAGANEVLTYSFVHRNILDRTEQNVDDAYQLSNALSPDLHYYRLTILPSLLDKIHANVRAGYDHFAIFEIGKGHRISAGVDQDGVPIEQEYVSLALAGGDFYQAKAITEYMAKNIGMQFRYVPLQQGKLFETKRGALIMVGDHVVGAVGEYRNLIQRNFKLPKLSAGFEIDFAKLLSLYSGNNNTYHVLSKFPSAERDITLQVAQSTNYVDVESAVSENLEKTDLKISITPLGIYQPEESETKNVTLRISLSSHEKTLTGEEVSTVMDSLVGEVCDQLNANIV